MFVAAETSQQPLWFALSVPPHLAGCKRNIVDQNTLPIFLSWYCSELSDDNNNNNNNNNNKLLPKAVSTKVDKEVEHPYVKKCPNIVCVLYSL